MRDLLKRLRPRVDRSSSPFFALGFETGVMEYEAQFAWGSMDAGADRQVVVHLGWVSLVWSWAVRS